MSMNTRTQIIITDYNDNFIRVVGKLIAALDSDAQNPWTWPSASSSL